MKHLKLISILFLLSCTKQKQDRPPRIDYLPLLEQGYIIISKSNGTIGLFMLHASTRCRNRNTAIIRKTDTDYWDIDYTWQLCPRCVPVSQVEQIDSIFTIYLTE